MDQYGGRGNGATEGNGEGVHPSILLKENVVRVEALDIPRKDVADYLRGFSEEVREEELIRAVEVGVLCLQRAGTAHDIDFVKRQVEALLREVDVTVASI